MSEIPISLTLPTDETLLPVLQIVADGIAGPGDDGSLQHLTDHLARALEVDHAMIAQLTGHGSRRLRVIAMTSDAKPVAPFEYDLAGTPCEEVVRSGYRYFPERVQFRFPVPQMQALAAESYAGILLYGADRQPLGLLAVIDRQPMRNVVLTEQVLRIFAVRAAAELERRQAAGARADQYRAMFNAATDGLVLFDAQGRVVDANPTCRRMIGYPEHDALRDGDPFAFLLEDGRELQRRLLDAVQQAGHFHGEATGRRHDGTIVTLDVNGVRMDYQGTPHLLAIFHDITQAKTAEKQLSMREEQYRVTFNAASDGMALWTMEGKLVDVNQACCDLHGLTREQLLKAPLTDYVPPESMPKLMKLLETVREGRAFQDEAIATHKNGDVFQLDMRGVPATFQGERHVLLVLRDITATKKNQEALRDSEERYHTMFSASVDGVALCTPEGRIMDANPAFCRMHGYTREELLAVNSFPFIHPDSVTDCRVIFEAASRGQGLEMEARLQRKDGTLFDTEVHSVPVQYGDAPHLLLIMRDVTDRKQAEAERARLEAQLRQSQKMEAIGQLTGGIAHDFNNILTSIMGYIVMAQEWEQRRPDPTLQRYLERIQRSAGRARDLIQQMLTFSRGSGGEPRPLQPVQLAMDSIKLLESMLPSTIQTTLNYDEQLPPVLADPVHLEQVLLNLCINARDAMAGNGRLEIGLHEIDCKTSCICSSCRKPATGRFLALSVRDTGTGIERDMLDRIFEPFVTTKGVGKGSGMGLAMVHGIVHEYGGHIRVESEPGKGTCIRVLLPRAASQRAATAGKEASPALSVSAPELHGEVLLVDDDPDVREYMKDRLQDWGLAVTVCGNGLEALALIGKRSAPFDFYLFDYTMPGMTGIELAREVRRANPTTQPILFTGYAGELSADMLRKAGIREVLRKPVELDRLRTLIEQVLAARPSPA